MTERKAVCAYASTYGPRQAMPQSKEKRILLSHHMDLVLERLPWAINARAGSKSRVSRMIAAPLPAPPLFFFSTRPGFYPLSTKAYHYYASFFF